MAGSHTEGRFELAASKYQGYTHMCVPTGLPKTSCGRYLRLTTSEKVCRLLARLHALKNVLSTHPEQCNAVGLQVKWSGVENSSV